MNVETLEMEDVVGPPVANATTPAAAPLPMWREEIRHAGIGLALAAVFGVALGTRQGGLELLAHAVATPLALIAVGVVGVPALYIGMAVFGAPIQPAIMARAAARGMRITGSVLAGLAPMGALFVVTTVDAGTTATIVTLILVGAGVLGLRAFAEVLGEAIARADHATRTMSKLLGGVFALVAILVASRVWGTWLPILGGVS